MKNIFVFALEEFNHQMLRTIRGADNISFHPLLSYHELVGATDYPMADLLAQAEKTLEQFQGSVDGVIVYWDFPASTMAPIVRRKFDLRGPSLESVLRCEHKFWSRVEQRGILPEVIPGFCVFNPFADDPRRQIDLDYPFWVKPVRAHSSCLGFKIDNDEDFSHALEMIREGIHRFAEPFNHLLRYADLDEEVRAVDGFHCVAEEIIEAPFQCTVEGYVQHGQAQVYGVVDSLRTEGGSSFTRYQYPSQLPANIQQNMIDHACRLVTHVGLENSPFNIEFFYDPQTERLSLLEVNARISKSHCPLFFHVDGVSHQQVAVNLSLGQEVDFPDRQGQFAMAAKFMLRRYEDARVAAVPAPSRIEQVCEKFPGTLIRVLVNEGDLLSSLEDQDSYSYEYGEVFIGGDNEQDLERKYQQVMDLLDFEFEPVDLRAC